MNHGFELEPYLGRAPTYDDGLQVHLYADDGALLEAIGVIENCRPKGRVKMLPSVTQPTLEQTIRQVQELAAVVNSPAAKWHTCEVPVSVKAGDEAQRMVAGWASRSERDAYGDRVEPSAFTPATLRQFMQRPALFDSHLPTGRIGSVTKAEVRYDKPEQSYGDAILDGVKAEREGGLYIEARLFSPGARVCSDEMWAMLNETPSPKLGFSIGFKIRESKPLKEGGLHITGLRLVETSIVSLPAAPRADIEDVKAALHQVEAALQENLHDWCPEIRALLEDGATEEDAQNAYAGLIADTRKAIERAERPPEPSLTWIEQWALRYQLSGGSEMRMPQSPQAARAFLAAHRLTCGGTPAGGEIVAPRVQSRAPAGPIVARAQPGAVSLAHGLDLEMSGGADKRGR